MGFYETPFFSRKLVGIGVVLDLNPAVDFQRGQCTAVDLPGILIRGILKHFDFLRAPKNASWIVQPGPV